MTGRQAILVLALAAILAVGAKASEALGPLRLVDQTPTQLLFLQPFPEAATPLGNGRWRVNWDNAVTNTIAHETRQDITFHLNLETFRSALSLARGVGTRGELGIQVSLLSYYEGFLDGFIRGVERTLGAERNIRANESDEQYVYEVFPMDEPSSPFLAARQGSIGFGDVSLMGKWLAFGEGEWAPAIAVRAALELPTGDEADVFGNGAVDWSLGVLAEKRLGKAAVYFNADTVVPGGAIRGLDPKPFWNCVLAFEWPLFDRVDGVVQIRNGRMALVRATTTDAILGLSWRIVPSTAVQLGFAEDVLNSSSLAADFSLFLNLSVQR